MQINEVIRKYRKENNLTQEEMAVRLGVTAPAVNKWESGASMPDVSLLAPIARLLHISLDELLSFKEKLSDVEIRNILTDVQNMFLTEPVEAVHRKMVETIREYPNAGRFDYAVVTKNVEETLRILDILMASTDNLMDYRYSSLFEHMTFKEGEPGFAEVMRRNLFNQVCNDDAYAFVRESEGWEAFKEKWS